MSSNRTTRLGAVLPDPGSSIRHHCDFVDGWIHDSSPQEQEQEQEPMPSNGRATKQRCVGGLSAGGMRGSRSCRHARGIEKPAEFGPRSPSRVGRRGFRSRSVLNQGSAPTGRVSLGSRPRTRTGTAARGRIELRGSGSSARHVPGTCRATTPTCRARPSRSAPRGTARPTTRAAATWRGGRTSAGRTRS